MKRYLAPILTLVFVLSFCLPAFAFDEVEAIDVLDEVKVVNTVEERDFIKQKYANTYILPGRFILHQSGGNNQIFVSQTSAGDYAKIHQVGNSNTTTIIQR